MICQLQTKGSLCHNLDHQVNNRGHDQREINGARHGARRVFYFAAGNERNFDSDEGEEKKQDTVA